MKYPFQFTRGNNVVFQFDDAGVARTALGKFVRVDEGGMFVCTIKHTNIEVACLPYAVRPEGFGHTGFMRKINNLVKASQEEAFAGSMRVEDAKLVREKFRFTLEDLKHYVQFFKV